MMAKRSFGRLLAPLAVLAAVALGSAVDAQAPVARLDFVPADMSLDEAVVWTLQNNPELATFRAQRGIAAANVVIARTYPFNPTLTVQSAYATGPSTETITNRIDTQLSLNMPVEVRHQGRYRQEE